MLINKYEPEGIQLLENLLLKIFDKGLQRTNIFVCNIFKLNSDRQHRPIKNQTLSLRSLSGTGAWQNGNGIRPD